MDQLEGLILLEYLVFPVAEGNHWIVLFLLGDDWRHFTGKQMQPDQRDSYLVKWNRFKIYLSIKMLC